MSFCPPGHFIGNISSLKCERFAKLGRICRLLISLVRNVASIANVSGPRFHLFFVQCNCSVSRELLSADLCWTHGCRLKAYKVELVKLLAIFFFLTAVYAALEFGCWHIISAVVLMNLGCEALGKQQGSQRLLSAIED